MSVLGGYTSSVVLGVVALIMLIEQRQRIAHPHIIHFNETLAIAVAGFGLCINLISALLLKDHDYDHSHDHAHHHHNLKAAYFHVQAFYAFPLGCNVRSGFKANNYEIACVERADLLSDYRAAAKLPPIKRRQARGSAKTKNIIMIIGDGMGTAASWVILSYARQALNSVIANPTTALDV